MKATSYARKQIMATMQENGIQNVLREDKRLFIEFPSGKCYELSREEIIYQAKEFLKSELESLNNE